MRFLCYAVVAAVLAVGLLAPILANDAPLFARADGRLCFPAFRSFTGEPGDAPDGRTWKEWWLGLDDDGGDWAIMPLVPSGPFEPYPGRATALPSAAHPLGSDDNGRDVLARLIWGAGTAVRVALAAVLLAMAVGLLVGGAAGLAGGALDAAALRVIEVFLCFPPLVAVLAAAAFFGGSLWAVIVVLAMFYWTAFARVVRGELLSLREREFVLAARGLGVGPVRLLVRHMLPCVRGPLLVAAAFVAADAIVVESTLNFLGLGLGLETVSWGGLLAQGKMHAPAGAWHLWLFPGLAVALTVLALHGVADHLGRRRPDGGG